MSLVFAKDLYRRLDRRLSELHARVRGREFLAQSLEALFETDAGELGCTGAELLAHAGARFERLAHAGRPPESERSALLLAELHSHADGHQRVQLLEEGPVAFPLAFFELAHDGHTLVFLFRFGAGWDRPGAELLLNTACSILSVKLSEERLGAALREAAEIQRSLLPPGPPAFPGFDIAARSQPADEVGGDWFDFLPLGEGSLGISIGDASGHGLPAALMARDVVVGLRMGIEKELKAGYALAKLNRVLHASTLSSCFASLLYGELEENGSFFYYSAGHDAPLLVTDGGCTPLRSSGTVLGPLPEARFRRHFAHLDHGAMLALYTDGMIERRSRTGELFGLERLQALLKAGRARTMAELLESCFEELERFAGGRPAADDQTLVLVRRS